MHQEFVSFYFAVPDTMSNIPNWQRINVEFCWSNAKKPLLLFKVGNTILEDLGSEQIYLIDITNFLLVK